MKPAHSLVLSCNLGLPASSHLIAYSSCQKEFGNRRIKQWDSTEGRYPQVPITIIFFSGHICVNPDAASPKTLLWNYEEVLNVIESSQSVVVVLSGHYHAFKHIVSPRGKHYISIKGVIETPPSGKAWGIVRISEKSLRFKIHNGDTAKEWESLF